MKKNIGVTYHLSHIDLDGFGAQYITANVVKGELKFLNCNYGEIFETIATIKDIITDNDMLLITDINLTKGEAVMIDALQKEIGFDLQLLDHHGTGKDVAPLYDWYHLDTSICGTMITFQHFGSPKELEFFAEIVNAYDLWKQDHKFFSKGKMLTRIVDDYAFDFPAVLVQERAEFIIAALDNAYQLLQKGMSVAIIENHRYFIERNLFLDGNPDNDDLTLHEIKVLAFTEKIMNLETPIYTVVEWNGYTTYVFTGLSRIFQTFSNKILMDNDDIDIAVNISSRGTMSIRSRRTDLDLGQMSKKAFGGGGHPQASGGKLNFPKGDKPSISELLEIFINSRNKTLKYAISMKIDKETSTADKKQGKKFINSSHLLTFSDIAFSNLIPIDYKDVFDYANLFDTEKEALDYLSSPAFEDLYLNIFSSYVSSIDNIEVLPVSV